jgi:hypothetical protein
MSSSCSRFLSVALFALLTLSGTVSAREAPRAALRYPSSITPRALR